MSIYEKLCEARNNVLPRIEDKAKQEEYLSILYKIMQIAFYNGDELPKIFTILNGLDQSDFCIALKRFGFKCNVANLGCGSGKNIYRIELN